MEVGEGGRLLKNMASDLDNRMKATMMAINQMFSDYIEKNCKSHAKPVNGHDAVAAPTIGKIGRRCRKCKIKFI